MTGISQARPTGRVHKIFACIKISQVYSALAGREPRRIGSHTWRAVAVWRGGDGFNVSMDDARGLWHDFTTDEGGGILDLVVRVRGGDRADALRWCANLSGMPLEDTPLSAEDRARWAAERREFERDLPAVRHWRRTAIALSEQLLCVLKRQFFGPTAEGRPSSSPRFKDATEEEKESWRNKAREGATPGYGLYRRCSADYVALEASLVDLRESMLFHFRYLPPKGGVQ